jgi:hypothetical protein
MRETADDAKVGQQSAIMVVGGVGAGFEKNVNSSMTWSFSFLIFFLKN